MAPVCHKTGMLTKECGFIDPSGKIIIAYQFDDVGPFGHGLAPCKKDGKWGYVDKKGTLAIRHQFVDAGAFHAVSEDGLNSCA